MNREMRWLGTGSCFNIDLGNTSFMVRCRERALLVDCGSMVTPELMRQGLISEVTDIIITHAHADHIGGLEQLGLYNYIILGRRGEKRPNLYVGSEDLAHSLWENSLKGGMGRGMSQKGNPISETLDSYFRVRSGRIFKEDGLPCIRLIEREHIKGMENYGMTLDDVYYSGDTVEMPPSYPRLIFQDHQFFEGDVNIHATYRELRDGIDPYTKSKTWLVHIGKGQEKFSPRDDGFSGFVLPGDVFYI